MISVNVKNTSEFKIVSLAVKVLRAGGLVIFPTETLYGAAVDATNQQAVEKLSEFKSRPLGKPYSIAVSDITMAGQYASLNTTAENLYRRFLPGPLTIISICKHNLAKGVESEIGTIGIRIPDYPLVIKIIERLGHPITATSANAAYKKRPYQIADIIQGISMKRKKLINLIIDAGQLPRNEPSTVVDTTLDETAVLRQGRIKIKNKNLILTRNAEQTQNFAKELWHKYEPNLGKRALVFALEGPMGTGKTQFVKGLARAMEIKEEIISPTYLLANQYPIPNSVTSDLLYHFDAWRMETPQELKGLKYPQIINDKSVIAIEWADRVSDFIRQYDAEAIIIWVKIKYGKSVTDRNIEWGII